VPFWRVAQREGNRVETIAHRILALAKEQGDLPAICSKSETISYRELGLRATHLAERLRPLAKTGTPLAVATNQTVDLVTAALAGWILGCPYLPLDPAAPVFRLEHMLRDSGAAILIASAQEVRQFPTGPWTLVAAPSLSASSSEGVIAEPEIASRDTAYVIYTSGSTGLAKGVAVSHANLAHFSAWYHAAFDSAQENRATQFASLTFDASVFEIWPTLSAGASIWPIERMAAMGEHELRDFIVDHRITHCFAPTAVAEELLDLKWPCNAQLRFLLTGADTLRRFPPAHLPFQLINNYGPTECTVLASSGTIEPTDAVSELPSIGRPIPGSRIYLLDENRNPVAEGEIGEIFIGGENVSLGYIGHAASMNDERFVPDLKDPAAKMYRTGDRARLRADGALEFAGRIDSQLKIRGYRVEPDEIVQKLRGHKSVHVCAVKASGTGPSARLLVYLELNEFVTSDELREYLADHLPAYMIPDVFIRVDKLPLSDRGKVDMAALPAPEQAELLPTQGSDIPEAQSEIESEVAVIIAQLLNRPSVKTTDNFFRLGGHSLLAAQVIARVRQYFGVELPIRAVFEGPTVQALALVIEQKILAALIEMPGGDARVSLKV
jgi:amino acid adenylation domain-containing protein